MGCGCGGRRNASSNPRPAGQVPVRPVPRQVQIQPAARRNPAQVAKERTEAPVSSLGVDQNEALKKKKIQISLKNRTIRRSV